MMTRLGLNAESFVVEVASNDGYLLQYFVQRNIPVLGIEPAANVAKVAVEKGIPTLVRFFGAQLAEELVAEGRCADLVLGNNVLAQVPDVNDFVEGLKVLLQPEGVLTLEFPHLLRLMEHNEFDTIYHEHFSYFSLLTTVRILQAHGLKVFDVEELTTHGGSLRVYACRAMGQTHDVEPSVWNVIAEEKRAGLASVEGYESFALQVQQTKWALLDFLLTAVRQGKTVAGYGAPGKSATLLHYCGIGKDSDRIHGRPEPIQAGALPAGQSHPDLSSRPDQRDQAGLCCHPAVEPERRNHAAVAVHPGVGRPLCRAYSARDHLLRQKAGRRVMKVVLFWRRRRHAAPGVYRRCPQTYGADWDATDSLALRNAPSGYAEAFHCHKLVR